MLWVFCFFFFTFLHYSAKELSSVSKCKKAVMCLTEKIDLPHNFPLPSSIVLMAMSSLLISQQYIPYEVSLNSVFVGLTLCDPMNCNPPGSSVHGILQARIVSGLPFPSLGDLPNPGIEPGSPVLQADTLLSEPQGKPLPQHKTRLCIDWVMKMRDQRIAGI